MRATWIVIGLTLALIAGPLHAADTAKAAVAEGKAEVLEEKVANDAPPPKKTEKLTSSEAQAVDPAGRRRWTTASPAWHAPSTGKPRAPMRKTCQPWPVL